MRKTVLGLFGFVLIQLCRNSPSHAQVVLFFEGIGAESGVTVPGATTFSFMGSNWSGGVVATEGIRSLYASGRFSYEVREGPAQVVFENPVDSVSFFYVHGLGFSSGTARAFDDAGSVIASVNSREATFFGDPNNVVVLDPQEPIRRIEFSAGVIDDFRFVPIGAQPPATGTPTDTSIPLASPTPEPPATATEVPPETPTVTYTASPAATSTPTPSPAPCTGDCDGNGEVTVDEIVRGVNIALGNFALSECPVFDPNQDGEVTIEELIQAVNVALNGCV